MKLLLIAMVAAASCMGQQVPVKTEAAVPVPAAAEPTTESWVAGSIDFGYRWRTQVGGSFDSYRSVVDLGSGPKLLGADFVILNPSKRLFDRIDVRAANWGDDPYSTLHLRASKSRRYEFSADYRNMAYFNALPSFGNPLLNRGSLLNERSFDIRRRLASMQLDLRPGSTIIPYLAYERSSGSGRGVTTFVSDANEYAVPNILHDSNDTYRAGVRMELLRFHATAEMGRTAFSDRQQIFEASAPNLGNRRTTYLGQRLFLGELQQSYDVDGGGVFTKFAVTSNPLPWLDVFAHVLYSAPDTDTKYQQSNSGNFALSNAALFLTSQQFALSSGARMPHTAGSAGAEIRPGSRARVLLSYLTDRIENSGTSTFNSLLRNTYSQADVDLIVDLTRQVILRGGYRYAWGDSSSVITPQVGLPGAESADLRRHVGKGGVTYHPAARLAVSADVEAAISSRVYFRTSLHDYQRLKTRARYQATSTLAIAADMAFLNNQNPAPGLAYDFLSRSGSMSVLWTPAFAQGIFLQAIYSRSTLRSDTSYIAPQFFERERSFYRDNTHTVDGSIDLALPRYGGKAARLSFGGSFYWSSGSRPTRHYQPLGNLTAPLTKTLTWTAEWRYHGFGESIYGFEAFRTHIFTSGIRVSR